MAKVRVLLLLVVALFVFASVVPTSAGLSQLMVGTLDSSDPTIAGRPSGLSGCPAFQPGTRYYEEYQLSVTGTGDFDIFDYGEIDGDPTTIDVVVALYRIGEFNSADPTAGCMVAYDMPLQVHGLTTGVYTLIVTSFSTGDVGDYYFDFFGTAGNIEITGITLNPLARDGRENPQASAPVVLYCVGTRLDLYSTGGALLGSVEDGAGGAFSGVLVTAREDGRMEVLAPMTDGKSYLYVFDGCSHGAFEAYTVENGVATQFHTGRY